MKYPQILNSFAHSKAVGQLTYSPNKPDYTHSAPIIENIKKANALYDLGHTIIYWTARGTVSGKDWKDITEQQFKNWGVKYHEIKFGKPYYDLFIDDKNLNSKNWKEINV